VGTRAHTVHRKETMIALRARREALHVTGEIALPTDQDPAASTSNTGGGDRVVAGRQQLL
jgi:hypothetical protein